MFIFVNGEMGAFFSNRKTLSRPSTEILVAATFEICFHTGCLEINPHNPFKRATSPSFLILFEGSSDINFEIKLWYKGQSDK